MTFKNFRLKAQNIALAGGLICLACAVWLACFYLSAIAVIVFWLSFAGAVSAAVFSFPRRKSLAALGILTFSFCLSGFKPFAVYHSTRRSPDGRFQLVAYGVPRLIAFPGQGSDAFGYVQLQTDEGRVLREGCVETLQLVADAGWNEREVEIGRGDGSYVWELPER